MGVLMRKVQSPTVCCLVLAASLAAASAFALPTRGYVSRPCGLDLNRNGVTGEVADCTVLCSGTAAPHTVSNYDGLSGHTALQWFVDCGDATASDSNTCQSASAPCKTLAGALGKLSAPAANTRQVVCFTGQCNERITNLVSGTTDRWTRPPSGSEAYSFEYPSHPLTILGWNINGDGDYPPHDTADKRASNSVTAVLEGSSPTYRGIAFNNVAGSNASRVELGHFSAQNYGGPSCSGDSGGDSGFMRVGSGADHFWLHDLELTSINKACAGGSQTITINLFTNDSYVAIENLKIANAGAYTVARGGAGPADSQTSNHLRFKNITATSYGTSGTGDKPTGIKLWGFVDDIEVLDSILDNNVGAWSPNTTTSMASFGVHIAQCAQNVAIRNSQFLNGWLTHIGLQAHATGFCDSPGRPIDNVVIDANEIRVNRAEFPNNTSAIQFTDSSGASNTVNTVTITNNVIWADPSVNIGVCNCFRSSVGNVSSLAVLTFAGNTCYSRGPFNCFGNDGLFRLDSGGPQNVVVKDNIFQGLSSGQSIWYLAYAPTSLSGATNVNGNDYGANGVFRWTDGSTATFAQWKNASHCNGCDANSVTCAPTFVNASGGNFHLASGDTCARDAGVNISAATSTDYDGDVRPQGANWDIGADEWWPATPPPPPPVLVDVIPVPTPTP